MPVEKKQSENTEKKEFSKDNKDFKKKGKFGFKPRKKRTCEFCTKNAKPVSYKDEKTLRKYISERGKILPRHMTGACAKHQRQIVNAINRARHLGILPYVID